MTYDKINKILYKYYKRMGLEPLYLIVSPEDFKNFTSNYNMSSKENILTIDTQFGNIYLEGKEGTNEPVIIA